MELMGHSGWEQHDADERDRVAARRFKINLVLSNMLKETTIEDEVRRRLDMQLQRDSVDRFR